MVWSYPPVVTQRSHWEPGLFMVMIQWCIKMVGTVLFLNTGFRYKCPNKVSWFLCIGRLVIWWPGNPKDYSDPARANQYVDILCMVMDLWVCLCCASTDNTLHRSKDTSIPIYLRIMKPQRKGPLQLQNQWYIEMAVTVLFLDTGLGTNVGP